MNKPNSDGKTYATRDIILEKDEMNKFLPEFLLNDLSELDIKPQIVKKNLMGPSYGMEKINVRILLF